MNTAKIIDFSPAISDEEALRRANALSTEQQNHRFSVKARDEQIFGARKAPRIRLVGGHAVMCHEDIEPQEVIEESVVSVEVSHAADLSGGAKVRGGRGLYGLNKKRRENYRG